jgi:hypothetical protein
MTVCAHDYTRHSWSQRMERQAPMMPLSFSSRCGGPMPARDASPQTVCRWVPGAGSCGRDHTTNDAGLCWIAGSLSFFEQHTTAVCAIARLRIQRRRMLRLPTITTLRGRRRGSAESATRKCPSWRQEGSPWLQSATTAAQLISKPSCRDGPQPGYCPAQLCAAAHPGRPRPHRSLLQHLCPLMTAYCFPEVRSRFRTVSAPGHAEGEG